MERRRSRLNRRQFVAGASMAGAGLLAGGGRWPWQAEPAPKGYRIGGLAFVTAGSGVLAFVTADPSAADNAAFRQGLRDLGYSEGQNITLEWRSPGDRADQYPELAADLVGHSVDVIVAQGFAATQAAKQTSTTIPMVMAFSPDPVRNGFVASLARPGGNVTGLATLTGQLSAKRLEMLRDTVPGLARVAMLWSTAGTERAYEFAETAAAAQALGLGLQSVELRSGGGVESAFASILQGRAETL